MDYRNLFRKLEENLGRIERTGDLLATLSAFLERLVDDFRDDLGLVGGRIYVRDEDDFVLQKEYPAGDGHHLGYRIPASYPPIRELMRRGFILLDARDPGVDREIEQAIDVSTFAAIRVGETRHQLIAFSLREPTDRTQVVSTLNMIRHAINLNLRKAHLEDRVQEMRAIQGSLLPPRPPRFEGYDLWGATLPAEEVGGDLYDFLPVSERALGVAIADAAGHGLPAALQARDAIVGLRMGVEERLRITSAIEKLNRVINHSALASRFISLFYCEVEPNGNMIYCNAGHNPPLLHRGAEILELRQGGLVLGPNPEARYSRGYKQMRPGSVLLMYTDGIIEAERDGEMFGVAGLERVLRARRWTSARELVETVFAETREFSGTEPPLDDQTVVAVIRLDGED
jgi:sigma-B regulation protein RsbU (phosphoserine phosphatase)